MRPTKQVALSLGCNYIYDEWGRINKHADKVQKGTTLIAETLPTTGEIDLQFSPMVSVSKTAVFAFLQHCDLDFKGKDVGEIIDDMTRLASRFIIALDATGDFEPIENHANFNAVIDFLDANMAGVRCELTLKEHFSCGTTDDNNA